MAKVTLKIEPKTHKNLVRCISLMQIDQNKRISIDEALNILIAFWESNKKQGIAKSLRINLK